ncbi:hypothetical protein DFH94DRAFT_637373 [Russula ochroleuca]|uniref:ENTH domain-containing protein n=1 Tax=Russula ochroleuca TaxID=152965 RepID=A0A9P5MPC7_9AGAM|nr:hypothetical protein DFH94DRAFT_637373 [Russula ochroleuca]
MDRIESLGNTISNLTMYDIKSMYNQAKNVVFNVSEMEAKVREATNEDPWGASSTLMQEIAQGFVQQFNEIMPCIYSQFMEKEARQWRQIYKALQLLEYLIKHGSERVVDDARSHVSTLKMLRSFHYIDEKGKDQGINVRNRSKELVELLADVDKIRQERKKAKANRSKYIGTGNDGFSFGGSGGRYGGFGNEGGSYSGDYGSNASGYDRGMILPSSSGGGSSGFRDTPARRSDFEEYDAGDYETSPRRSNAPNATSQTRSSSTPSRATGKAPEPASAPVMNLLDFDDTEPAPAAGGSAPSSATAATNKALPALAPLASNENAGGDDDFADFQAAPSSPPAAATSLAAVPVTVTAKPNLMDLLASTAPSASRSVQSVQPQSFGALNAALVPPSSQQLRPSSTPVTAPAYGAMPVMSPMSARSAVTSPVTTGTTSSAAASTKLGGAGGGFDDLWSMSLGSATGSKPAGGATAGAKSIRDLEKEKAYAGIWGTQSKVRPAAPASVPAGGFGSFAKPLAPGGGGDSAGADDLLL